MRFKKTVDQQAAYILHSRAYSETSLIIDVFTSDYGKLSLLARGARRPRSLLSSVLQPFQPLLISWAGRGELLTLTSADLSRKVNPFYTGRTLMNAFYVNEILIRLLQKQDPHPDLFISYSNVLIGLQESKDKEWALRLFEVSLLHALGYSLNLTTEAVDGENIEADTYYTYQHELGLVKCKAIESNALIISGNSLLALSSQTLPAGEVKNQTLLESKRLLRVVLGLYLGSKPLASRSLFKQSLQYTYN